MRFKLDENLPEDLLQDLINLGHDPDSVRSEGLIGAEDNTILEAARQNDRVLLTLDKGIPTLLKASRGSGVVLFRPGSMGKKAVLAFVRDRLKALLCTELKGRITVVTATRVRVRLLHT